MSTIPVTDAKARLSELVEETAATHERVTITRHGRPAVVMLAVEDLEALEETLFWQSESGALNDVAAGRATPAEEMVGEAEVRRRYGVGRRGRVGNPH